MQQNDLAADDPRVASVRRRIARWRLTRQRRSAMPAELWEAAVELALAHGVYAVARDLDVSYGSLRARVERSGGGRPGGGAEAEGVRFVELDAALVGGRGEGAEGTVVELASADGSRLVIRFGARDRVDVRGLAEAFWGRGR